MDKLYNVVSGHYLCHPETCNCDNWKIEGPDQKKCFSSDDKAFLQARCDELNTPVEITPATSTETNNALEKALLATLWTITSDGCFISAIPGSVSVTIKQSELYRIAEKHKMTPNVVLGG
jgi:hypothetical protein